LAEPGSDEEKEFIGIPGLLEPEHVHELLMQRTARQSRHREARESRERETGAAALPEPLHRTLKEQRQLLNNLVGLYSRQTGEPHGRIHAELRRTCGGPAVAQATVAQLQKRIQTLRRRVRS
ncbi:MAG: ATP-dependent helicase, partial [Microbacterium sp.]